MASGFEMFSSIFAKNRNYRLRPKVRFCILLQIVASLFVIISPVELRAESTSANLDKSPLVEVETSHLVLEPYRNRRAQFGWMWSLIAENYYPAKYMSILDGTYYQNIYGASDIAMSGLQGSIKYNLSGASVYAGGGYQMGSLRSSSSGSSRQITMGKKEVFIGLALDGLTLEPYIVPYAEIGFWTMDLDEKDESTLLSNAGETGYGKRYKAGTLIQLNWLDPESSKINYMESGLQNTFVNLFVSINTDTDTASDPSLASDAELGLGLTLEF